MSKQTQKLVRLKEKAKTLSDKQKGELVEEYLTGVTAIVLAIAEEDGNPPMPVIAESMVQIHVEKVLSILSEYSTDELGKQFNAHAHFVGVERSK